MAVGWRFCGVEIEMFAFVRKARAVTATLAVGIAGAAVGGCSDHIFEQFDLDGRNASKSVDAKQRFVFATREGGKSRDRKIVCAEPSPDAFSVTAASAAGSSAVNAAGAPTAGGTAQPAANGGLGVAGGRSESGASIAMRTQTVQLLRDGLYRACEAYMNGAIDQNQYNVIIVNVHKLMVTLMGIDAIGGTQNVAPVAISANAPGLKTGANAPKPGADAAATATGEVTASDGHGPFVGSVTVTPPGAVQSEAIANVILAAHAHSSYPALCVSLLSSGELRLDNPGQYTVLKSCDYLLNGSVRNMVASRRLPPPESYEVSKNAAVAATGQAGMPKKVSTGSPVKE